MSNGMYSVAIYLNGEAAFGRSWKSLMDLIGAEALLYAAIAYLVFDESYYVDDMLENCGEMETSIVGWLEHFSNVFDHDLQQLRMLYETHRSKDPQEVARPLWYQPGYKFIGVTFVSADDTLLIRASRSEDHHQFGNQWRILNEGDTGVSCDWHVPRTTIRAYLF